MRQLRNYFITNYQRLLLLLLLFFLPLQTRWIIQLGTLENIPWEFSTISLYGTDILILAFIASVFLPKLCSSLRSKRSLPSRDLAQPDNPVSLLLTPYSLLPALVLWFFASILWSPDKLIAVYQSLKLLEGVLLFLAIRHTSTPILYSLFSLLSAAVLQAALGSWQFLTQTVIANKWLGMALHEPWQSGAAVVETELRRWLRAYGTLPHPNILGAYLVVGTILAVGLLLVLLPRVRERAMNAPSSKGFLFWSLVGPLGLWLPYVLLVAGLFFTFSRAAWIAFFLSLVFIAFRYFSTSERSRFDLDGKRSNLNRVGEVENRPLATVALIVLIPVLVFATLGTIYREPTQTRLTAHGRLETKSTTERLGGYARAWESIKKYPILGTGIGQSTRSFQLPVVSSQLPAEMRIRSLEGAAPIHNVPLLVFVELGLIGGAFFLTFLISLLRSIIHSAANGDRSVTYYLLLTTYCVIVLLTLFDHSFWTLHPGQMLFWVIAGFAFSVDSTRGAPVS